MFGRSNRRKLQSGCPFITSTTYESSCDMNTILVVDQEPRICGVIRDFFEKNRGMLVQCAHTGPDATRMLMHDHYELALISVPLPGSSDFDLTMLSVNERIPALLMTRDPVLRLMLQQFAFPYL